MAAHNEPTDAGHEEDKLFEDIQEFLAEQSGDRIYEELSRAYGLAEAFAERELRGRPEYDRMLRGVEKLVDDIVGETGGPAARARLAEILYLYGLAHYSLLQHSHDDDDEDDDAGAGKLARPLIVYDIWFPADIAMEQNDDGFYLHISDGRIDVSLYLGQQINERGALVDIVDHWEYATANTRALPGGPDLTNGAPLLAIEMDYAGSELIDASDHVDILLFDDQGEPVVRIHARDSDLRTMVDEMQGAEQGGL